MNVMVGQHLCYVALGIFRQHLLIVQGTRIVRTWTHAIASGIIIRLLPFHCKMDLISCVEREVIRVPMPLLEAL
jgi:hypothetical protein